MDAAKLGKVAFVTVGVATLFATTAAAEAVPHIDSTRLDDAVAGRQVELRVRATDPQAPVTGMVVGFGRGESGFGLSSCLPRDSSGRVFGPVALAGRRTTLTAPHVFATPGRRLVAARVMSAGCTGGQPSTLLRLRVPVVARGQKPEPIEVLPTETVPLGTPVPTLPGLGRLPLSRVDLPLPDPLAGAAASCPGSTKRVNRSLASRRAGRSALLCLLNVERRRHGLRPVRANRRLARAAGSHSRRMVQRRFFAHVGPGSLDLAARLRLSRYIPRRGGTWLIGENIGFGRGRMARPMSMHRAWMRSTPHRAAILERRFREVGFGIAPGSPYGRGGATFTVDFGRRR